jgi:hypothetical protein
MAMFVHLTAENRAKAILRAGIRPDRGGSGAGKAVYAVPVTPNFFRTHQWLRELKRRGQNTLVGVYFRVPDDTPVRVGHYGGPEQTMTAAESVRLFMGDDDRLGWEVRFDEAVPASRIHAVRRLPQLVGWRYKPGAHKQLPCGCDYCQRGGYGGRRIRRMYAEFLQEYARVYGPKRKR